MLLCSLSIYNVMKMLTLCHLLLSYLTDNKSYFCGVSVEVIPETDEDKIVRLEANLLQDLRLLKHRQVIHPVLQEGEFIQTHEHLSG